MSMARVRALVDLSFCLALIGTRDVRLKAMLLEYAPGALGISAITAAALHLRAARSAQPERDRQALAQFLLSLTAVEFDGFAAAALASLEQAYLGGESLSSEVMMVAAQALAHDAAILTCTPADYAALPDLRVLAPNFTPTRPALPAAPAALPAPHTAPAPHSVILAMGSHDLTLDLVGDRLHAQQPGLLFCTAHVGSLEGLHALRRGEAHLAGAHLLDAETGTYNVVHVQHELAAQGCHGVILGFVQRVQGLIVAPGNPKGIRTITDLARADVRFINRQPGAGTRVLLDHALRTHNIRPEQVQGYTHEEASHTAITTAIAADLADCGLGIQAAATAQGLGFVPLFDERYDLVIPAEHFAGPLLAPLLALLRAPDPDLLRAIHALGGYGTEGMGAVRAEF